MRGLFSRLLAWFAQRMANERQRLLAVTILAGGLCGLAAVAFHLSIGWLEDAADQSRQPRSRLLLDLLDHPLARRWVA